MSLRKNQIEDTPILNCTKGMGTDGDTVTTEEQIRAFAEHLVETGRSVRTSETYVNVLKNNFAFLKTNGRNHTAETITQDDLRFLMQHKNIREATMHDYLNIIDKFVKFCTGRTPYHDMDLMWNRRAEPEPQVFISKEDLAKALAVADPRQRMVLMLGAYMGLRTVEMVRIRTPDIQGNRLMIRGKGHRGAFVQSAVIPPIVMQEIERYTAWKDSLKVEDRTEGAFFFQHSYDKKSIEPVHHKGSSIQKCIYAVAKRSGVRITPHSLRRLFATTLYYDLGVDIITIRDLMRHADASTTMRHYIQPFDSKREDAMMRIADCLGECTRTHTHARG